MRLLWLALLLLLAGCAPLPQKKAAPVATPSPGYFQLQQQIFELPLDSLWVPVGSTSGRYWRHPRLGSLGLRSLELDPLKPRWPEWLALCQKKDLKALRPALNTLRDQPLYAHEVSRLEQWCQQSDRKSLVAWFKAAEEAWKTENFGEWMKLRLQLNDLKRRPVGEWKILSIEGQPAVSTQMLVQGGVSFGMYVKCGEQLLGIELSNFRFDTRSESQAWFEAAVSKVKTVTEVADRSMLQGPQPTEPAPVADSEDEEEEEDEPRARSSWLKTLAPWLFYAVAAMVIGLPAYGGATAGYEQALYEGRDPRVGAAVGAGKSTLVAYLTLLAITIVLVLVGAAVYNNHSGIMSLFMAGLLLSIVGGLVAVIYIMIASALAAVGAFIGAIAGPSRSGWLAVLGVLLSLLVTPVFMRSMDQKYANERRYKKRLYPTRQIWKEMAHVQPALPRCRHRGSADLRSHVSV